MLTYCAVQRGQLQPRQSGQSVFSAAGVRKEVNAVLEQVESASQKLGKNMDDMLATVATSRAAAKLIPLTTAALAAASSEAAMSLPLALVRLSCALSYSLVAYPWIRAV
jgi:hypothetical protein